MKKINNLDDLKERRQQIKQQQQLLEYKIKDNWRGLKEGFSPAHITKSIFRKTPGDTGNGETKKSSLLKTVFNYTSSLIQKGLVKNAADTLHKLFKK